MDATLMKISLVVFAIGLILLFAGYTRISLGPLVLGGAGFSASWDAHDMRGGDHE